MENTYRVMAVREMFAAPQLWCTGMTEAQAHKIARDVVENGSVASAYVVDRDNRMVQETRVNA